MASLDLKSWHGSGAGTAAQFEGTHMVGEQCGIDYLNDGQSEKTATTGQYKKAN